MPTPTPAQMRVLRALDEGRELRVVPNYKARKVWRWTDSHETVNVSTLGRLEFDRYIKTPNGTNVYYADFGVRVTLTAAGREALRREDAK